MNRKLLQKMADFTYRRDPKGFGIERWIVGNKTCVVTGYLATTDSRERDALMADLALPGLEEWQWCFSSAWASRDDTPKGAAKRMYWLLDYGLPGDYRDQMRGRAPLCYAG